MPISVFDEKPIRLSDMAKIVNVSRATVSRWAKVGSKDLSGRKIWLETVVHVGMFYTSMEAYGRFVKAMNSPTPDDYALLPVYKRSEAHGRVKPRRVSSSVSPQKQKASAAVDRSTA
jgi:hypothetical protein